MPARRVPMVVRATMLLAAVTAAATAATSQAASSGTVVGAVVPSATQLDVSGCAPGQAGRTALGAVTPGSTVASTLDCSIAFGSSNDTSMLRVSQTDGWSTAMSRDAFEDSGSGATTTTNGFTSSNASTWWVVGNSSAVRYTGDGGTTWATRNTGISGVNLNDIDYVSGAAGSEILVATGWVNTDSIVRRSIDGGLNWTTPTGLPGAASDIRMEGVSIAPDGVGWLIASTPYSTYASGKLYRTTDAGASWTDVTPACASAGGFFDIEAWTSTRAVAVGTGGQVCATSDGTNWLAPAIEAATAQDLRGIVLVDADTWWIVGHSDTVLRTLDGGATWTSHATGHAEHIWGVHATSATRVWVGGYDRLLLGSLDGGTTWTQYDYASGSNVNIRSLHGIGDHVFATGSSPLFVQDNQQDPVDDYDDAAGRDWQTVGTTINAFGACLSSTAGGAVLDGTTWSASADCPLTDGAHWRGVPLSSAASGSKVASGSSASTTPVANLRFAFRTSEAQPPGTYMAGLTFEVLAPTA